MVQQTSHSIASFAKRIKMDKIHLRKTHHPPRCLDAIFARGVLRDKMWPCYVQTSSARPGQRNGYSNPSSASAVATAKHYDNRPGEMIKRFRDLTLYYWALFNTILAGFLHADATPSARKHDFCWGGTNKWVLNICPELRNCKIRSFGPMSALGLKRMRTNQTTVFWCSRLNWAPSLAPFDRDKPSAFLCLGFCCMRMEQDTCDSIGYIRQLLCSFASCRIPTIACRRYGHVNRNDFHAWETNEQNVLLWEIVINLLQKLAGFLCIFR